MPREIGHRHQIDSPQPETAAEALAEVCKRAHRYAQQPTEAAWDNLVDALRRAYGDAEAFDGLHAAQIRTSAKESRAEGQSNGGLSVDSAPASAIDAFADALLGLA